jgi:hypothetical protein
VARHHPLRLHPVCILPSYCKWGDNCRHSHDGKKGGKRKVEPSLLLSKKEKKANKEIAAMVINDLKSSMSKKKGKGKDEDGRGR